MPEGVKPYLDKFYYDTALSGADAPMAALTALAPIEKIFYGSDWPYVERAFVIEQSETLVAMPQFAGERFAAMERDNAILTFPRFARLR